LNVLGAARLITERRVPHPAAAPADHAGAPCGGVMFPIPPERKLSFAEVANYWSREIDPSASPQELRDLISKAWWRGELIAANGLSRLSVLRSYYSRSAPFIAFVIPDAEEPPQWSPADDGAIEFIRPLRVPLPNADSSTWTDDNCAPAFEAIAEQWQEAVISPSAPLFLDVVLTSREFFQWIDKSRYHRPTFWSSALKDEFSGKPSDSTVPTIAGTSTNVGNLPPRKRAKKVQYDIHRAVEALTKQHGKFPLDGMPVKERDKVICKWLEGDDSPRKPSERSLRDYFKNQAS
jgi:hypothetical protein